MARRIDVHHHYIPPAYLQGVFTFNTPRDIYEAETNISKPLTKLVVILLDGPHPLGRLKPIKRFATIVPLKQQFYQ